MNFRSEFATILRDGFLMKPDEEFEFFDENEKSLNNYATSELNNSLKNVNQTLFRKFNDKFKKDEEGNSRNWKEIEEAEINKIFLACRVSMEAVIDDFMNI